MIDYTEFDKALIEKLRGGCTSFTQLIVGDLGGQADAIAGKNARGDKQGWRLIDRRLQALRKRGLIVYGRKTGWQLK